jgi:hypothetical protein
VDFFDTDALAEQICWALNNQAATTAMRRAAPRCIVEQFDQTSLCLPAHLALLHRLTGVDPVPHPKTRRARASAAAARPALAPAR